MPSYADIDKLEFIHRCLHVGYFPYELPPPLTTKSFADYVKTNKLTFNCKYKTKLVQHHLSQIGKNRRILSIPNPINQYRLVNFIADHYEVIFGHTNKSHSSTSKPCYIPDNTTGHYRAIIPELNFEQRTKKKIDIRGLNTHSVKTDISCFYNFIYTHSISWALHTKSTAKQNKSSKDLLGNILDNLIRDAQDEQSTGIPVGPDTSLVIAEIILSAIDIKLKKKYPCYYRWYDDYEYTALSNESCQEFVADLESELINYGLILNSSKTHFTTLSISIEDEWITKIRDFRFRSIASWDSEISITDQFEDINAYFSMIFSYTTTSSTRSVLRYALRKLYNLKIHNDNWLHFQTLLCQCTRYEPETLPYLISILNKNCNFHPIDLPPIDLPTIETLLHSIIKQYSKRKLGNEVAWAIWGCLLFNININANDILGVDDFIDDIVLLLLLDAKQHELLNKDDEEKLINLCNSIVENFNFDSEHWLLAYEYNRLINNKKYTFSSCQNINDMVLQLLSCNVSFYNSSDSYAITENHTFGKPFWAESLTTDSLDNTDYGDYLY